MTETVERELPPPNEWTLDVVEVVDVNDSMRRVRLGAAALAGLVYLPGQDMAVAVESADGNTVRRRYTICQLDRSAGTVDIEIVMHGDGPGVTWARRAEPGQLVDVVAPRGKIVLDEEADRHLFLGDDSSVPLVMAMISALRPGMRAAAFLEVDGPQAERELSPPAGASADVTWLHRGEGVAPGSSDLLVAAALATDLPGPPGHVYVNGEFAVTRQVRAILEERGVSGLQLSAKPYWRLGLRNLPHGEPLKD